MLVEIEIAEDLGCRWLLRSMKSEAMINCTILSMISGETCLYMGPGMNSRYTYRRAKLSPIRNGLRKLFISCGCQFDLHDPLGVVGMWNSYPLRLRTEFPLQLTDLRSSGWQRRSSLFVPCTSDQGVIGSIYHSSFVCVFAGQEASRSLRGAPLFTQL